MKSGEELKVLVDYNLFEININGEIGVYLKTSPETGKHLVYFSVNGEYAEFVDEQVERINPGYVSPENEEYASCLKTMEVTFETL